jgi:hypothetical protein
VMVAFFAGWTGAPGQSALGSGFPDAVNGVWTAGGAVRRSVGVGAAAVLPQAVAITTIAASIAQARIKPVPRPRTQVPCSRNNASWLDSVDVHPGP